MKGKVEANSLWKHSVIHHEGELAEEDLEMGVVEQHRSPLTRQVHEGVALETNGADIILNSKAEWNSSGMPRIIIEHREVQEEDKECGMTKEKLGERRLEMREGKKRDSSDSRIDESSDSKRRKVMEVVKMSIRKMRALQCNPPYLLMCLEGHLICPSINGREKQPGSTRTMLTLW